MIIHSLCTAVFPYVFYTVATMVFGVIFFDEMPTVLSIIGLIIVLVALAMLVIQGKKLLKKLIKTYLTLIK